MADPGSVKSEHSRVTSEHTREYHLGRASELEPKFLSGTLEDCEWNTYFHHMEQAGEWRKLLERPLGQLEKVRDDLPDDEEFYSNGRARHLTEHILDVYLQHRDDENTETWYRELVRFFPIHESDTRYHRNNWDFSRKKTSGESYKQTILRVEDVLADRGSIPLQKRGVVSERLGKLGRLSLRFDGLEKARPYYEQIANIAEPHVKFVRFGHTIWYLQGSLLTAYYRLGWFEPMKDFFRWQLSGLTPDEMYGGELTNALHNLGFLNELQGNTRDAQRHYREAEKRLQRQSDRWGLDSISSVRVLLNKWMGKKRKCRDLAGKFLEQELESMSKGVLPRIHQLEELRRIALLADEVELAGSFFPKILSCERPGEGYPGEYFFSRVYLDEAEGNFSSALSRLDAIIEYCQPIIEKGIGVWSCATQGTHREASTVGTCNFLRRKIELRMPEIDIGGDQDRYLLGFFPVSFSFPGQFTDLDDSHEYFSLLTQRFPGILRDHEGKVKRSIWIDPNAILSE